MYMHMHVHAGIHTYKYTHKKKIQRQADRVCMVACMYLSMYGMHVFFRENREGVWNNASMFLPMYVCMFFSEGVNTVIVSCMYLPMYACMLFSEEDQGRDGWVRRPSQREKLKCLERRIWSMYTRTYAHACEWKWQKVSSIHASSTGMHIQTRIGRSTSGICNAHAGTCHKRDSTWHLAVRDGQRRLVDMKGFALELDDVSWYVCVCVCFFFASKALAWARKRSAACACVPMRIREFPIHIYGDVAGDVVLPHFYMDGWPLRTSFASIVTFLLPAKPMAGLICPGLGQDHRELVIRIVAFLWPTFLPVIDVDDFARYGETARCGSTRITHTRHMIGCNYSWCHERARHKTKLELEDLHGIVGFLISMTYHGRSHSGHPANACCHFFPLTSDSWWTYFSKTICLSDTSPQ